MFKKLFKFLGIIRVVGVEVVYAETIQVPMCTPAYKSYDAPITTQILATIYSNGDREYSIRQFYSLLPDPFYDCEYNSNRVLEQQAKERYNAAQIWISNKQNDELHGKV